MHNDFIINVFHEVKMNLLYCRSCVWLIGWLDLSYFRGSVKQPIQSSDLSLNKCLSFSSKKHWSSFTTIVLLLCRLVIHCKQLSCKLTVNCWQQGCHENENNQNVLAAILTWVLTQGSTAAVVYPRHRSTAWRHTAPLTITTLENTTHTFFGTGPLCFPLGIRKCADWINS